MSNPIISIGVDQGIASCGYSVVKLTDTDVIEVIVSGTIKTPSSQTYGKRLNTIYEKIQALATEYEANIIGCEKLFFNPKMKVDNRNKSASMMHTNMATAVLHLVSESIRIPIVDFVPGTIKKFITGNGRATKEDVENAVTKIMGDSKEVKTEHEADAIAIGITAVKYYKENKDDLLNDKNKKKKRKTKKKKMKGDKDNEE